MIAIVNQKIQDELAELMGADDLYELLQEAAVQFDERIAVLETAWMQEDWAATRAMAHKIKGSMGSLGYDACFHALDGLERQLLSQPAQVPTAVELGQIKEILIKTRQALASA